MHQYEVEPLEVELWYLSETHLWLCKKLVSSNFYLVFVHKFFGFNASIWVFADITLWHIETSLKASLLLRLVAVASNFL